jgi:hypothetical protein
MNCILRSHLRIHVILIFCFMYFFYGCKKDIITNDIGSTFKYEPKKIAPGMNLGEVYDTYDFAAFTDIVYYDNAWYVTFRVGRKHLGGINGEIKILKSTDAVTWKVDYIIENDSLDLRDPKFILDTSNNKLYINFFGAFDQPTSSMYRVHNFFAPYSSNSSDQDYFNEITNDNTENEKFAFWRYTYYKGKMYCAAFRVPLLGGYTTDNICLFNNNNNISNSNNKYYNNYATVGKLVLGKSPNEATIRFDQNDKMYLLIRRETANVILGTSEPSDYSKVKWIDDPLGIRLSSPNFLFYHDKLLICGRDQDKLTFKFFSYNLTTNKIEKQFTLPSGVETGYGGMSFNPFNKDELFMSYYIITNDKSYIYLAKVDLKTFLQ